MPALPVYILSLGGAIFVGLALNLGMLLGGTSIALPLLCLVGLVVWGTNVASRVEPVEMSPAASRMLTWATIGEVAAIIFGVNVVNNLGHRDWIVPAIALAVGLHFLPLGRAMARGSYVALGVVLVLIAGMGFALPAPRNIVVTGLAAGLAEWAVAIYLIIGLRRRALPLAE